MHPIDETIFFEHAPVAMALVDVTGRFVRVNPAYTVLTGHSRTELLHTRWQSITHPEDLGGDEEMAIRTASGLEPDGYGIVKRYLHKAGGSAVWVNLRVCPVKDSEGRFILFAVFAVPLPNHGKFQTESTSGNSVTVKPVVGWIDTIKANPKQALAIFMTVVFVARLLPVGVVESLLKMLIK